LVVNYTLKVIPIVSQIFEINFKPNESFKKRVMVEIAQTFISTVHGFKSRPAHYPNSLHPLDPMHSEGTTLSSPRIADFLRGLCAMDRLEEIYLPDRKSWQVWLERNHGTSRGIWLVFYKNRADRPSLSYGDALDEALCYGWIDSIIKKLDGDRYARKFTPRKPHSSWSHSNIMHIERLTKEGRMLEPGMAVVEQSKLNGEFVETVPPPKDPEPPAFLMDALATNRRALASFNRLARSQRRSYILWLLDAKRGETRKKRLDEALRLLERGEPLGLK